MHKRKWSKQACITWMCLALAALGTGQALGVALTSATEEAVPMEVISQPLILTGTVMVEEEPVYGPEAGFWTRTAPEGKVSAGQTLFTGPVSTADAANRVRVLSGAFAAAEMAPPRRSENLHKAITGLSAGENDMADVMALVLESPSEEDYSAAQSQLAAMVSSCQEITAPVGGVFVAAAESDALGRIITGRTWRLSLVLPFAVAVDDTLSAELLSGVFREVEFTVEQVEPAEGGCRALLVCEEDVALVAKNRNLTVKILSE